MFNQKNNNMYIVKHKRTNFKHYFDKEQFATFYQTTGKKLISKNKNFTDVYSVQQIKEYNTDKIVNIGLQFIGIIMMFLFAYMMILWI